MSVSIRMKRLGRKNRPFYRICATDKRAPRDGRVIEELGTYDPYVPETDARCTLNGPRVDYWLSVGAQPSDAVRVLIKKYGPKGTHLKQMEQARMKLSMPRIIPAAGEPVFVPEVKSAAAPAAAAPAEAAAAPVEAAVVASVEAAVAEAPAAEASAAEGSAAT